MSKVKEERIKDFENRLAKEELTLKEPAERKGSNNLKLQIDLSDKTIMAIKHGVHSLLGTILLIVILIIVGRGCMNITDKINDTISNKKTNPFQYEKN